MVFKTLMINRSLIVFVLVMLIAGGSLAAGQEARTPAPPSPPQKVKPPKAKPDKAPGASSTPEAEVDDGRTVPVTAKLPRGGKVSISSRSGHIVVAGWDRDIVEATASGGHGPAQIGTQTSADPGKPRLLLTTSSRYYGREINVALKVPRYADVEMLAGSRGDVEISDIEGAAVINIGEGDVHVTRAGSLKVSRRRGDIIAKEIKGDLTARTFQGDIVADNVGGSIDAASTNGDLQIRNAGGDVRANSATGEIGIHCAKGRVDAAGASGSITMVGIGGDVEASTASGNVTLTGAIRDGSYRLKSLSGEVSMTIQPDVAGFTATLTTYNGNIETDFPIKVESPLQGPINRRISGRYGDGRAKLSLDSFNGTVKIAKGNAATMKGCK
jgi:DUF4097 and DUF4098 domain-containing protein YvlB